MKLLKLLLVFAAAGLAVNASAQAPKDHMSNL